VSETAIHSERRGRVEVIVIDRGGPMFYADTLGLGVVLDGVHRFAETLGGKYWAPAPLLEELGRSGGTFQAWRAGARREESGS
jgi:hypothetical protein